MTSMDGSKYCTDDLSDGSYESESSDYTERNGHFLYSYRKYFGPLVYWHQHEPIGRHAHFESHVHLSPEDIHAIYRCGLTIEKVDNISEIGNKLEDLEVLYSKSILSKKLFQDAVNKKKPTEFDIYTLIQFQYETVPEIYKQKADKREKQREKYEKLEDKYTKAYFFPPTKPNGAAAEPSKMRFRTSKLRVGTDSRQARQKELDDFSSRDRTDSGRVEVHKIADYRTA